MGYYESCAIPKPGTTKKIKLYNGYKHKAERFCAYCGESCAERHEVFGASNRQTSIAMGFQVDVCDRHHAELHENCSEWAKAENRRLRRYYELSFLRDKIKDEGYQPRQALNEWMNMIGRNYVEEIQP